MARTRAEIEAELATTKTPEYLAEQERIARLEYAPTLENISLAEQRAQQQADLAGKEVDLSKNALEGSIADSIRRINRQAAEQQSNFLNQQQKLGIRSSGLTETGLYNMNAETGATLSRLEADRANRLAQLALQSAGTQDSLASAVRQAQISRMQAEQNIASRRQGYIQEKQTGLEALLNQLDQQELAAKERAATRSSTRTSIPTTDLGGSAFNRAYNDALYAVENIDTRIPGKSRDRLLSQDELADAQAEVARIARLNGVDAVQLWEQIMADFGFQLWTPEIGYDNLPTYDRVSKAAADDDADISAILGS